MESAAARSTSLDKRFLASDGHSCFGSTAHGIPRLTPLLSLFFVLMTNPTDVGRIGLVLHWKQLDAAESELTPSILATWVVPSWLSLQERSAAGSQLRLLARQSWSHRWGSTLACAAARAFASSLLDRRGHPGTDGDILSEADFLGDFCRAPSAK